MSQQLLLWFSWTLILKILKISWNNNHVKHPSVGEVTEAGLEKIFIIF